jgi:hypothetical protein
VKPTLDTLVLYYTPSVRREREARRQSKSSDRRPSYLPSNSPMNNRIVVITSERGTPGSGDIIGSRPGSPSVLSPRQQASPSPSVGGGKRPARASGRAGPHVHYPHSPQQIQLQNFLPSSPTTGNSSRLMSPTSAAMTAALLAGTTSSTTTGSGGGLVNTLVIHAQPSPSPTSERRHGSSAPSPKSIAPTASQQLPITTSATASSGFAHSNNYNNHNINNTNDDNNNAMIMARSASIPTIALPPLKPHRGGSAGHHETTTFMSTSARVAVGAAGAVEAAGGDERPSAATSPHNMTEVVSLLSDPPRSPSPPPPIDDQSADAAPLLPPPSASSAGSGSGGDGGPRLSDDEMTATTAIASTLAPHESHSVHTITPPDTDTS